MTARAIGVWGAGRETRSFAAQLARAPAARADRGGRRRATPREDVRAALGGAGRRAWSRAPRRVAALARCDVVVRSPGVSIHRPELRALRAAGMPVTTATALWLAERGGGA